MGPVELLLDVFKMSRAVDVVSNVGGEVGRDALVGYEKAYHQRREMRGFGQQG